MHFSRINWRELTHAAAKAGCSAAFNAGLAVALMLLMEFGVSGQWRLARPYLWAGGLIAIIVFIGQLYRQIRIHSSSHPKDRNHSR